MASSGDPFAQTAVGLSSWSPLIACSIAARWAWIAMWSSAEMQRACVGIFPGSVGLVAEVARIPFHDTVSIVNELEEKKLIEHDPIHRLIRFAVIPDRSCRPFNGNHLTRWWHGFRVLPACPTRDRHVPMVRWICGEPLSKDHERVWPDTFGTIAIVSDVSRTSDTMTQVVDVSSNQRDLFNNNDLRNHGGNCQVLIPDPDPDPDRERARERGLSTGGKPPLGSVPAPRVLAEGTSPRLPIQAPNALTATAMLTVIAKHSGGRFAADLVDSRLSGELERVASECALAGVTFDDLESAGAYLQAGALAHRDDLNASWAARPGAVMGLISSARRWRKGELRLEPRRARSGEAEVEIRDPAPPSAFKNGLRAL